MELKNPSLAALTCAAYLGAAALSQANVLVSEDFSYANGGFSGQSGGTGFGGNVWFNANSSISNGVAVGSGESSSKRNFAASLGTTGTVWVRFDWGNSAEPESWGSYGGLTFYNGTSDGGTEIFLIGNPWAYAPTQARWNISSGSGDPGTEISNTGMKSGVAKLDLGAGTVSLWVGATGSTIVVGGAADASVTGLNLANIQGIRINGSSGPTQSFDNLIIGTSMDDVNAIDSPPISGAWSNVVGGPWGTAGNWLDNLVATGSGNTADFSTLNISADTTVNLDTARTITNLVFGDTDTSSAAGWTLANNGNAGNILTLAGTTPSLTVNALGTAKTATIRATVAGSAGFTKSGPGTLILTGTNTYTGTTQINAGTLQIGDGGTSGTLGSGPVTIASGATLIINRSDDYSPSAGQSISGAGALIKEGTGTLTLSGNGTHTGGTTINDGTLKAGANQAFGNSDATVTLNGGSLDLNSYSQTLAALNGNASSDVHGGTGLISMLTLGSGNTSSSFAGTLSGNLALVKIGTGTLTLTGTVSMNGIITVQEGTLDLSAATLSAGTRINTAKLAVVKLPTASIGKLYVDHVKLAPGRWGSPGSVAASLADFESPAFSGSGVVTIPDTGISCMERWKIMKYGFFVHYTWDGSTGSMRPDGTRPTNINETADSFDATGFANDMQAMGVEYVVFTAWHANFFPLFNSSAMNKYHSGRTPNRDMIGEMITAVRAKGIRVLLYTHPYQPIKYLGTYPNQYADLEWNDNLINDVYAELVDRYGDQLDGLFLDENFGDGSQDQYVDYDRLLDTIRHRNPELVLMQNWGSWESSSIYTNDMMHREKVPEMQYRWPDLANNPYYTDTNPGPSTQLVARDWAASIAKVPTPTTTTAYRSAEGIFRTAVVGAGSCTLGGGWIWGAGPYAGDGNWPVGSQTFVGRWEPGVLEAMQGAAAYIAPVAASIKNTYPSTSWLTAPYTTIANLPQGFVATRSTDDTKEYIHVLNPPGTKTLNLPLPADGKVFTNARLLKSGHAVTLTRYARDLILTLGASDNWETLDTVIVMDVASPGARSLTNDNDPAVTYTGTWVAGTARNTTEYGQDVHETSTNGNYLEFTFHGTDIDLIGTCAANRGTANVSIDGVFQKTIDLYAATDTYRRTVFSKTGLPRGEHTLKVVKTGGTYLTVDAFRVTELINSNDPSLSYSGAWSSVSSANAIGGEVSETSTNEDTVILNFEGNGVDVIGSKGLGGGNVRYKLDSSYELAVPQSSNFTQDQALIYTSINSQTLNNGLHTLTGWKRHGSWADVDAFRIYKGTSTALRWGASGTGGTGTWNINTTANWYDGSIATKWQDYGGTDYAAIFGGNAGTVTLASNLKVNRLTFNTTGYTVTANSLILNGLTPTITTTAGVTSTIASTISTTDLTKAGDGTLSLTKTTNPYTGTTIIVGGTLNAAKFSNYTVAGSLGTRASDSGGNVGILFRGGTLQYTGSTAQSTNRAIRISTTGGATIDASGSKTTATLSFTATTSPDFFENPGNRTLTLTGSNTGSNTFAMAIGEAGGITSLVKSGAGKWMLTGANTYTGNTTVNGGTLSLSNANLANTSNVLVASGAKLDLTFSGTDTVNQLWLGGSRMPAGVYSSSNHPTYLTGTGTGTITVTNVSASGSYAAWSGQFGYHLTGGPSGDDDNDGIKNLIEYVLGGNPLANSSEILPSATATAGNLVFTFRRIHASIADTSQVFQYSSSLSDWTDAPIVASERVAIQPDTPQAGTDTVTITIPATTESRIFGRLKVSTLPAQP